VNRIHAYKLNGGIRPFMYRNRNAQSKTAIIAPHTPFILNPINIRVNPDNVIRMMREMNSKEKSGSAPIANNLIYSKNMIALGSSSYWYRDIMLCSLIRQHPPLYEQTMYIWHVQKPCKKNILSHNVLKY